MNIEIYIEKYINQVPYDYKKYLDLENKEFKAFYLSCIFEQKIEIIQDILNIIKNFKKYDSNGNNGFMLACWYNKNLPVVQYLETLFYKDINHINEQRMNAFTLSCSKNENLEVIKYLSKIKSINIFLFSSIYNGMLTYTYEFNAFQLASFYNDNLKIAHYLIEEIRWNIIVISNNYILNPYHYKFLVNTNYIVFFDNEKSKINIQKNIVKKLYLLKKIISKMYLEFEIL